MLRLPQLKLAVLYVPDWLVVAEASVVNPDLTSMVASETGCEF